MIEQKLAEAYRNIKSDTENYVKSFLAIFLSISDLEKLEELYNVFIGSSNDLFSPEILNHLEYLERKKQENSAEIISDLKNFLYQNISIDELMEYLMYEYPVEFIEKINPSLFCFKLKDNEEKYLFLVRNGVVLDFRNFDIIYNTKISKIFDEDKEIIIVKVFSEQDFLGYLTYSELTEDEEFAIRNGVLDSKKIRSQDRESVVIRKIVKTEFRESLNLFSGISVSNDFNYNMMYELLDKQLESIDNTLIKEFVSKFYKYLFNRCTINEIREIDYFCYSSVEIDIYLKSITSILKNIRLELEKYNESKLSYKMTKEKSEQKLLKSI